MYSHIVVSRSIVQRKTLLCEALLLFFKEYCGRLL